MKKKLNLSDFNVKSFTTVVNKKVIQGRGRLRAWPHTQSVLPCQIAPTREGSWCICD